MPVRGWQHPAESKAKMVAGWVRRRARLPDFWDRPVRVGDCLIWPTVSANGYGTVNVLGRSVNAHRFAYEDRVGPIPEGLTLDHLCRNRACVNPAHLEAVSMGENIRRGVGPSAVNARKTHCPMGHPLSADNIYRTKRGRARTCRTCDLARQARYRASRRVAEGAPA